jgi:hypothetical protein
VICVAGMPRSGTSLVTQLLHRCGLDLGPPEQLMAASINNTDGFWENVKFVQINERLLAAKGGKWFAPPAMLHVTPEITAEAKSIVAQFEGLEWWGWKDPRNAITLPFWKTLLPTMKVLVCVRHPAETAASLAASTLIPPSWLFYWWVTRSDSRLRLRNHASRFHQRLLGAARTSLSAQTHRALIHEVGLELWRVYNASILDATAAGDRLVTHYEAVLTRPRAELERVLAFAGIRVSSDTLDEAVRVVSPRMQHQQGSDVSPTPEIAALYAQLCREAECEPDVTPGVRTRSLQCR